MITKIFSGALSDWLGRRKALTAFGYGLAAFIKPIFPLATNVGWLVAARFVDRLGKGIRGAPRDALIADLSPADLRGASFGLRQSLDTVGAFVGPLAAIGLMVLTASNFTVVFWIAVIPAFLSFGLMIFGVEEPARKEDAAPKPALHWSDTKRLTGAFWAVVAVATVLTLARFSEAFLVLRSQKCRSVDRARTRRDGRDECRIRSRRLSRRGSLRSSRPQWYLGSRHCLSHSP
jgi:hypothetical protein